MPTFNFDPTKSMSQEELLNRPKSRKTRKVSDANNPDNQGIIFQLTEKGGKPQIEQPSDIKAKIKGSAAQPDMYMKMNLMGFHVDESLQVSRRSRATFRLSLIHI